MTGFTGFTGSTLQPSNDRTPLLLEAQEERLLENTTIRSLCSPRGSFDGLPDARPVLEHAKGDVEEDVVSCKSTLKDEIPAHVTRIICVLLIGGFISNADTNLVLATHPIIASEFDALDDSSWLINSFALASAATQPLYGKLSDIYGRKVLLVLSYALFGIGLVMVGIGTSMCQLILGRIISGAGSSGMTVLVAILISDLLPLRDVATWRGYVNIVATTGRSVGGPLGGWLADTVGWRWSFLGQAPFALLGILLVIWTVPDEAAHFDVSGGDSSTDKSRSENKLARVDFIGATLMALTILLFLCPLQIGGVKVPWNHPLIWYLFGGALVTAILFLGSQKYVAKEPIFPLELLQMRDFVASIVVQGCQSAAQMGMMFAVPLYFQITARASNTVAGAHLVPAVVGNAIGGLLAGWVIKRTGKYKALTLLAETAASLSYLLLILRWHGHTNLFESLYIAPGGFGSGIAANALFISVQAAMDVEHMAVAASALYLSASVGMMVGIAACTTVLQGCLRWALEGRLLDMGIGKGAMAEIIEDAVSDVHYVDHAEEGIVKAVVGSYVEALAWTHGLSLVFSLTGLMVTLLIRQRRL